jgi:hypothetical protein
VTIEIHEPELEALIRRRMETGRFRSIEEVLLVALKVSAMAEEQPSTILPKENLADFLLRSPLPGSGLDLERVADFPRAVDL